MSIIAPLVGLFWTLVLCIKYFIAKLSPKAMLRGGGRVPRYEKSDILLVIHIITYLRSLKIMLMGESAPPSS